MYFFIAFVALFGLVCGSFLNVCVYRMPRNCLSIVSPASHCPSCQNPIRWYDNLPVVSYIFLLGQCRHCGTSISYRYPLVEAFTSLLFLVTFLSWHYQFQQNIAPTSPVELAGEPEFFVRMLAPEYLFFWIELLTRFLVVGSLLVLSLIDLEFFIIPDELSLGGLGLGLFICLLFPDRLSLFGGLPQIHPGAETVLEGGVGSLLGMIVGGGVIYFLMVFGKLVFRKEAMGWGDVKFMAAIGGMLGWLSVPIVLVLSSVLGSIAGIGIYLIKNERYIPFGPFLSLATAVYLWKGPWFLELLNTYFIFT